MGIKIFIAVLIFYFPKIYAQHFEWASAGSNLWAGFRTAAIDHSDNLIVAGAAPTPTMIIGIPYMYDSYGDSTQINIYENPILIISYNPEGKINWIRRIIGGRGIPEVYGIAVSSDNKIYILCEAAHGGAYFPELKKSLEYELYFIYCLKADGTPESVLEDTLGIIRRPNSFSILPNGNFLISGHMSPEYNRPDGDDISFGAVNLINGKGGANYLIAFNKTMLPIWGQTIQYHSPNCCEIYPCFMDISPQGDIYVIGSYLFGGTFDKGSVFSAPIIDSVTRNNKPYEAYLACYSQDGKLKWVKRSGGKSIFNTVKATTNGCFIGGTIVNNGVFFGEKIDTTQGKRMLLASFDKNGNLRWAKTSNAEKVNSLAIDHDNNVYASIVSTRHLAMSPFILETDTIPNSYHKLIIASYSADGKYRWLKKSSVPMSSNEFPIIVLNRCGDIYVAGEMWYTLKVQMSWFDAAFVKGTGYGSAPFTAKLKNTLTLDEKNICVISPGPWSMQNYPNPFSSTTEFVYTTTYDDTNVSLELYDINGKKAAVIFNVQNIKKGEGRFSFNGSRLANGTYIAVLKGTSTIATTTIIISR